METHRPKIYCQFTNLPYIEPISGDRINEIRFYRALSTFADVYYNDCLINWDGSLIGHPTNLNAPSRDYDLYYVRAQSEIFKKLPHPKVTMAYPYCSESFEVADAVLVTTQAWKRLLSEFNDLQFSESVLSKWYPSKITLPKKIINIGQCIDPTFVRLLDSDKLNNWKSRFVSEKIFGFFGRITKETIPTDIIEAISAIRQDGLNLKSPVAAFAGVFKSDIPNSTVGLGHVSYQDLPSLLSICTGVMGQDCKDSLFLGSGKIMDAMAVGVPIVCRRTEVREEQLGSEYRGYYSNPQNLKQLIMKLCEDFEFWQSCSSYLLDRRKIFLPEAVGHRIKRELFNY